MTECLYKIDPLLTRFDAIVTDIQEFAHANGQTFWRMTLNRTAFAPTRAVQPDETPLTRGRLIATARSGAELTAEIVHVEEDTAGQVWHHTVKPLQVGTTVRGEVDTPSSRA